LCSVQLKGGPKMAITPGDLTHTVAKLLALPLNTVKNYDRKLMEAGMRSKKGHGRGSATMTPADAVSLLIGAACVGCEINKIASAVKSARNLPWSADQLVPKASAPMTSALQSLCKFLKREPSEFRAFGPAMDAIMAHLVEMGDEDTGFSFEITTAAGTPVAATIMVSGEPFARKQVQELHFWHGRGFKKILSPALLVKSEVNWEVTEAVANLLASRDAA
jgi:hypothetical protein